MDIDSLNILKDGRITISSNNKFYIYNSNLSEKKCINFISIFQYHGILKSEDFLEYPYSPFIFRLTYYNKPDYIQDFPNYTFYNFVNVKNIFFLEKYYLSIWRYISKVLYLLLFGGVAYYLTSIKYCIFLGLLIL